MTRPVDILDGKRFRMVLVFGTAALISGVGAGIAEYLSSRFCLACVAWTFAWPACVYAVGHPSWFGKRPDGTWCAPILAAAPFLFASLSLAAVHRAASRETPVNEIAPGLFLARRLSAREWQVWSAQHPGVAVLDVTAELPEPRAVVRGARAWRCVPMLDAVAPSAETLHEAVAWVVSQRAAGPVFVHCALGHGRSATVCAVALVQLGHAATVKEAVQLLQQRRPLARPTEAQLAVAEVVAGGQSA